MIVSKRRNKRNQRGKGKVRSGLGNRKVGFGCTSGLELRAGSDFNFSPPVLRDVLLRECRAVPTDDLQVRQLADSLLHAWVQNLTRQVLTSAGEGQAQSYVLCVPAPSQKCKDMLQSNRPIMPFFTEEYGFSWLCGARSGKAVWLLVRSLSTSSA